jgi:hypothetical protein
VKIIFYLGLNMSLYGYGFEGMGYRYPRRARKAVIADPKAWARAAIYNKGVVEENPWVTHLRNTGVYDKIRELLESARATYVPKNPEKRKQNLIRQLRNLEDEYRAISGDYPDLKAAYKYKAMPYDAAREAVMKQIAKKANQIMRETGEKTEVIPYLEAIELIPPSKKKRINI